MSTRLHVLRVFVGDDGEGGNPLGVFLDGAAVPVEDRQRIAADLGYSETVFVDDHERAALAIFTPGLELPFAGHPLVGTAWLMGRDGQPPAVLRPPAGDVAVRRDGASVFIVARPEWTAPFAYVQLDTPAAVDQLDGPPNGLTAAYCWAWIDEEAGLVRARSFVPEAGVDEDEATGSAALTLSARIGRAIEIRQGAGSLLHARPLDGRLAEVGGLTELVEVRDYPL